VEFLSFIKSIICRHKFKIKDMQPRNQEGNVIWPCCKCGKIYIEECGLDVLNHGKCIE
jgi:hypothetical protein